MSYLTLSEIHTAIQALRVQAEGLRALLADCKHPRTLAEAVRTLDRAAVNLDAAAAALARLIK